MTCDFALNDEPLPLPDMEEVYQLAAARVTDAVQRGLVDLALRWGRIFNLALRDRQMRARLPVTPDEVRTPPPDAPPPSPVLHSSHPVFETPPEPEPQAAKPIRADRRRAFREARRRG
ncbi:hypothetical protein [Brevundimonas sp.]|uniref:hypothetical protein n=1 Tax=Brevundimonas sp. TaxID=1871086 RepID=UPI003F701BA7